MQIMSDEDKKRMHAGIETPDPTKYEVYMRKMTGLERERVKQALIGFVEEVCISPENAKPEMLAVLPAVLEVLFANF